MFAVPADEKLKVKQKRSKASVNVPQRFFPRGSTAAQSSFGSGLVLQSKMADGGEEVSVENHKNEEEVELDLAKCATEFAQYCQVDVRNEVKCPSEINFEQYFDKTTADYCLI